MLNFRSYTFHANFVLVHSSECYYNLLKMEVMKDPSDTYHMIGKRKLPVGRVMILLQVA